MKGSRGTCPRCESELRYLEKQLERRAALGKTVTLAALCTGMALASSGCSPVNIVSNIISPGDDLSGAVPYNEPADTPEPYIEVETGEIDWPGDDIELMGEVAPFDFPEDTYPFNEEEDDIFLDDDLSGMVAYEKGSF